MAYYAPFYRPTYYDPVQQNPMGQFNQQYQQPIQNAQMPMQGQPTNDFLWVLNENEATSYPVAPNNTVTLRMEHTLARAVSMAPPMMTVCVAVQAILMPAAVVDMQSVTAWADTAVMMAICAVMGVVCATVIAVMMARRT